MSQFMAITFRGRKTAQKALDAVEENNDYIWLDDIAVVSRSKHGYVRVHSTWAQDDSIVRHSNSFRNTVRRRRFIQSNTR